MEGTAKEEAYEELLPTVLEVCKQHNVTLIFACLSGSFPNGVGTNGVSDFDIRGVVVRDLEAYISLGKRIPQRGQICWFFCFFFFLFFFLFFFA
jgi:hypothetical protein